MHACINTCIRTYVRAYIHTYIHFCWFNFDALAQGNAYYTRQRTDKSSWIGRDLNHQPWDPDCGTIRRLPVVQRVRFTPLSSRQKTLTQWHARGGTGKLTTRLECTGVLILNCALALAIYMFAVVNFDALAQANDIRIERRQVVYLCWMQDSKPGSLEPNLQQTECPLTNWLSHRESN